MTDKQKLIMLLALVLFAPSARGAEVQKKSSLPGSTITCPTPSIICPGSLLTNSTTHPYPYFYIFGGGNAGTIATIDSKGKATICGGPSTETEIWEMWSRLEAASRLGRGAGFCAWYGARRR